MEKIIAYIVKQQAERRYELVDRAEVIIDMLPVVVLYFKERYDAYGQYGLPDQIIIADAQGYFQYFGAQGKSVVPAGER